MNNELTRACKLACEDRGNTLFKSQRLHSMNEGFYGFCLKHTFFNTANL